MTERELPRVQLKRVPGLFIDESFVNEDYLSRISAHFMRRVDQISYLLRYLLNPYTTYYNIGIKEKLGIIPTPYGEIVAFEFDILNHKPRKRTIVPGFYRGELQLTEDDLRFGDKRRIDVSPTPQEIRQDISGILKNKGYISLMTFWNQH